LEEYIKSEGGDIVGIGAVNRLASSPDIMKPERHTLEVKRMISAGIYISEAS